MKQTTIRIGHSPDPDDAFMFYALAKGRIPTGGFEVEHVVEDIESLNKRALAKGDFKSALEVTALSCHAFALVTDRYQLIPYGASVGDGYGPVLVGPTRHPEGQRPEGSQILRFLPRRQAGAQDDTKRIRGKRIAVPGRYTTAFLALQIYESDFEPVFIPFDQIFDALKKGEVDFGLLIHEGQLTYHEMGFEKIVDLGEWWAQQYHLPLPLGINAIRRDLKEEDKTRFNRLFLKSIDYAMTHREDALAYALKFGRGIDTQRGDRFVGMYVNDYSLDLGEKGKKALRLLFEEGHKKNILPHPLEANDLLTVS